MGIQKYHLIFKFLILTLFIFVKFSIVVSEANGQSNFIDKIDSAYRKGEIDYETYLINKAYTLYSIDKLDPRFYSSNDKPVKCGTDVAIEIALAINNESNISSKTRELLLSLISQPQLLQNLQYDSPGGKFRLHYDTTGVNAVSLEDADKDSIPDYVENFADYFDYIWRKEVDTLGYTPPPLNDNFGGSNNGKYDIVIQNIPYYGITQPLLGSSSYIVVDNDYFNFPPNTDPEGNQKGGMKVTAAHEFFHAIQFVYDMYEAIWWMEISSTWMEDIAFDAVNDYYNYLDNSSPFTNPEIALDQRVSGLQPYSACVWAHYLTENYGLDIMRAIWIRCKNVSGNNALQSISDALTFTYKSNIQTEFKNFAIWNYITGRRVNNSLPHYEEAEFYPPSYICKSHLSYPINESGCIINHLATNYIKLPESTKSGDLKITFDGQDNYDWKVVVITSKKSRYSLVELELNNVGQGSINIPDWKSFDYAILIPVSVSLTGNNLKYTYFADVIEPLTIYHTPQKDTEDTTNAIPIIAKIVSSTPLALDSLKLCYGVNYGQLAVGSWQLAVSKGGVITDTLQLKPTVNPNEFIAHIPKQPINTIVYYYLSASDIYGATIKSPSSAPDSLYSFKVMQDTIPPEIFHNPLESQSISILSYPIIAKITDNIGVESVNLLYNQNGSTDKIVSFNRIDDTDQYIAFINPTTVNIGDVFNYKISATDKSSQHNKKTLPKSGYYSFAIIQPLFANFENSNGGFVSSDTSGWQWGESTVAGAHSGNKIWGTVLNAWYNSNANYFLDTPIINLSGWSNAVLEFYHWYKMMDWDIKQKDGGNVKISTDDGITWKVIEPIGGYPETLIVALNEKGYAGISNNWEKAQFDLNPYLDKSIKIRFHFKSDSMFNYDGWYIDDVSVKSKFSAQLPSVHLFAENYYDKSVPILWKVASSTKGQGTKDKGRGTRGESTIFTLQSTNSEPLGYNVYRGTKSGIYGHLPINSNLITGNSFNDNAVNNFTKYYYVITAVYSDGESGYSEEVSATPGVPDGDFTLFYDDDKPQGGYFWEYKETGSAVRMTPPVIPLRVNAVQFYINSINSGDGSFFVWLLKDDNGHPGTELIKPFKVTPLDTTKKISNAFIPPGWYTVEIPESLTVIVDRDFYVAMIYDGINTPAFGRKPIDNDRAWDYDPSFGGWYRFNETYFMRAIVNTDIFPSLIQSFSANVLSQNKAVGINWIVNSNKGYIGFNLYRSYNNQEQYIKLNSSTILANLSYNYSYIDRTINKEGNYYYRLSVVNNYHQEIFFEPVNVIVGSSVPISYNLSQNYPNPFNSETVIQYTISGEDEERTNSLAPRPPSPVTLKIYNINGQLVKTLVDKKQKPGYYAIKWDGTDSYNKKVSSGIYFYSLRIGRYSEVKRMILLK